MTDRPLLYNAAYGPLNLAALRNAPCQMSLGERLFLYSLIYASRPAHYCEIGTAQGGSALIAQSALFDVGNHDARMSLIDIRFDLDKSATQMLERRAVFHEGPSTQMLPEATRAAPIDFLLIDGDHTHEGALRDIEMAVGLVAPGAHVLIHDAYNPPIAAAIAKAASDPAWIDVGLVVRHGNDLNDAPLEDGPWKGQPNIWGGMHHLRRR
ncbi:class I SAM-dependent methyltransferase [Oceanibaculum indicum]|uniref:Putative O-methyltransferase YrrM n=1 Tax=Oceanibaculum indicum TaxID=526216 RepID=A0A420WB79_9PROT|nr:class I SAM-dependent methyltransferase [Oceanibaculum indicum]RKQ68257.1 putative O-methyltransferase YrrM [Oceanibaculum indicum]